MNTKRHFSWAAAAVTLGLPMASRAGEPDREQLLNTLDDMAAAAGTNEVAPIRAVRPVAAVAPPVEEVVSAAVPAVPAGVVTARTESAPAAKAEVKPAGTPLGTLKDREIESSGRVGWLAVGMALTVLAGVATWLKRRATKSPTLGGLRIETIATTRLHGKHAVSLVKVGGRVLVVGQGEKGLTLLTELDDEESAVGTVPAARGAAAQSPATNNAVDTGAGSFVEKVNRLRAGWKAPEAPTKGVAGKNGIRFPADPFHAAMLDDAPVDELQRLDERAQIRERLEQLRRRSVAVA